MTPTSPTPLSPEGLPEPEAALVTRALEGDREAFGVLVARHGRRVVVTLLADGHALDVAKDLSQEAWAKVWAQVPGLAALTLPGLIVTQARFLAKDRARRLRVAPESNAEADAPAPVALADARLTSAQSLARVQARLGTLSPRAREVFELAHTQELAHDEVARRVGLSTQRVRQIIWEVRSTLRATLEEKP
jgi:RNA polymerase sigma-70 factor (ECF subfamily)